MPEVLAGTFGSAAERARPNACANSAYRKLSRRFESKRSWKPGGAASSMVSSRNFRKPVFHPTTGTPGNWQVALAGAQTSSGIAFPPRAWASRHDPRCRRCVVLRVGPHVEVRHDAAVHVRLSHLVDHRPGGPVAMAGRRVGAGDPEWVRRQVADLEEDVALPGRRAHRIQVGDRHAARISQLRLVGVFPDVEQAVIVRVLYFGTDDGRAERQAVERTQPHPVYVEFDRSGGSRHRHREEAGCPNSHPARWQTG